MFHIYRHCRLIVSLMLATSAVHNIHSYALCNVLWFMYEAYCRFQAWLLFYLFWLHLYDKPNPRINAWTGLSRSYKLYTLPAFDNGIHAISLYHYNITGNFLALYSMYCKAIEVYNLPKYSFKFGRAMTYLCMYAINEVSSHG